jgi:hypothetical protein
MPTGVDGPDRWSDDVDTRMRVSDPFSIRNPALRGFLT